MTLPGFSAIAPCAPRCRTYLFAVNGGVTLPVFRGRPTRSQCPYPAPPRETPAPSPQRKQKKMPRQVFKEHHTRQYRRARALLIGLPCWQCGDTATQADHCPSLAEWYKHHTEPWQGELRPSCAPCNQLNGGANLVRRLAARPMRSPIWKDL